MAGGDRRQHGCDQRAADDVRRRNGVLRRRLAEGGRQDRQVRAAAALGLVPARRVRVAAMRLAALLGPHRRAIGRSARGADQRHGERANERDEQAPARSLHGVNSGPGPWGLSRRLSGRRLEPAQNAHWARSRARSIGLGSTVRPCSTSAIKRSRRHCSMRSAVYGSRLVSPEAREPPAPRGANTPAGPTAAARAPRRCSPARRSLDRAAGRSARCPPASRPGASPA